MFAQTREARSAAAVLELIGSRTSAKDLAGPQPDDDQIRSIIEAGDRAPDHGRLRPWHVTVVRGDARNLLAEWLSDIARRRQPDVSSRDLARARDKAFRAPLVLIVAAKIVAETKIPVIEQVMAVSAAVQNMLIAAHALSLGAVWKTGAAAYDAELKTQLGLEARDFIVAFLYIGQPVTANAVTDRSIEDIVSWL
jgi:nitroreductase